MARALVIGCGGTLGFAWTASILTALDDAGWAPGQADILVGTSAGSELVAMLGAGIEPAEIVAALADADGPVGADPRVSAHLAGAPGKLPPFPRLGLPGLALTLRGLAFGAGHDVDRMAALAGLLPRGGGDASWLRALGHSLAGPSGWVAHPATWIVGADCSRGTRVAFGSPEAPSVALGDAIAASWAIPGWFPPVRIAGRDYLDGGTLSPTSADLLVPAVERGELQEVLIVAPMSSSGGAPARGITRLERLMRHEMTRRVDREVRQLRRAGAVVRRIEPAAEDLASMGANFMDVRRRDAVLATSSTTAPALVAAALGTQVRA